MRLAIWLMVLAASLSACSDSNRATAGGPTAPTPIADVPPPPAARVQGLVLDFQTARPVPGVVVGFATTLGVAGAPLGMTETSVTDANGRYSLPEPPSRGSGPLSYYYFFVDNTQVGHGYPRATNYRADIAIDKGLCIARYGMVLDSTTFAPIVGATARDLSDRVRATTGTDGWYHIDWGCGVRSIGFNTTWHTMSHPDYLPSNFAGGRGLSGNLREDVLLTPR